jgi:hypothetical protein
LANGRRIRTEGGLAIEERRGDIDAMPKITFGCERLGCRTWKDGRKRQVGEGGRGRRRRGEERKKTHISCMSRDERDQQKWVLVYKVPRTR